MTISELIELLKETMEKEGDIEVAYTYNDNGYFLNGEAGVCNIEVRQEPDGKVAVIWQDE